MTEDQAPKFNPLTHNDYDFSVRPASNIRNLAFVACLGRFIPDERLMFPDRGDGLRVVDLGAGPGFNANAQAFMYPHAHFHSVDSNEELTESARTMKASFGHSNITVHDGTVADYNANNDAEHDVVLCLDSYGQMLEKDRPSVWETFESVKDGGLAVMSYNCAVFNAQFEPFREFLKMFATTQSGNGVQTTHSALLLMQELVGEDAGYFSQMLIQDRFKRSARAGARKVFQEFLNIQWDSFYAHEIMPEFLARGFKMCGDAAHLNNAKAQAVPPSMVEKLNRFPNRIISETLYDYSVNRTHRSDLFVKGREKVSHAEVLEFLAPVRVVLRTPRDKIELRRKFRLNEDLRLRPASFNPIFDVLAAGPETIGNLRRAFDVGPEGDDMMIDVLRIGHALGYINLYYGEDIMPDTTDAVLAYDKGLTGWLEQTKAPAQHLFLPAFGEFRHVPPALYALAVSAREGGEDNLNQRAANLLADVIKSQVQAGVVGDEDDKIDNALERVEAVRQRFENGLKPVLLRGGYFRAW